MASPIVKWPGGKRRMVPQLLELIRPGDRLIEPFAGGMALSLAYDGPAVASDTNKRLIAMYEAVRDDPEGVIRCLTHLRRDYYENTLPGGGARAIVYYDNRNWFNQPTEIKIADAARLLFLNKTCFNGLYRENRRGEFNVPHGRYKNPKICDPKAIRACSERLQAVELRRLNFSAVLRLAGKGDTAYCDPPYDDGFVQYTAEGFSWEKQQCLAHHAEQAALRGARVIVSNASTLRVRLLYLLAGFEINEVQAGRSISRDAAGRGDVTELLMMRG